MRFLPRSYRNTKRKKEIAGDVCHGKMQMEKKAGEVEARSVSCRGKERVDGGRLSSIRRCGRCGLDIMCM